MSAIDLLIPAPLAEPSRVEGVDLDERPAFRDELGRAARPPAERPTAASEPEAVDAPADDASPATESATEPADGQEADAQASASDPADTRAAQGDEADAAPVSDAPVDPVVAEAQELVAAFAGRTRPLRDAPEVLSAVAPAVAAAIPQALTAAPDPASTVATPLPLTANPTADPAANLAADPAAAAPVVTPTVAAPTAPGDSALNPVTTPQPQRTVLQAAPAVSATDAQATATPEAIAGANPSTTGACHVSHAPTFRPGRRPGPCRARRAGRVCRGVSSGADLRPNDPGVVDDHARRTRCRGPGDSHRTGARAFGRGSRVGSRRGEPRCRRRWPERRASVACS